MQFGETKDVSFVGRTIGNYKVVQQIGEGGMGIVYLAEHPVIGRKVAIKLLHATFAKDSDTVARFFNEARAIHMIAHPNIVEILDFGQTTDGQPYFIMEFLQGEPLADRIARGPMMTTEAVGIVSQICNALQAAHDKNIVHRDLKPHNVYLVGTGQKQIVKILDFGVAKMTTGWNNADSGGQSVKTRTGSLMGTPLYMSPEQCRGSGKLDHRTDIYSLSVILFEMIAGKPPFTAEGIGELFAKHMLEAPPLLAELAPRTPPHVVRAVMRALAKNLDDRFPTMIAFRDALNGMPDIPAAGATRARIPVSQPTTLMPTVNPTPSSGPPPAESTTLSSSVLEVEDDALRVPKKSHKGLMIALVVAVVVAGGAIVVQRRGGRGLASHQPASPNPTVSETTGAPSTGAPPAPTPPAPTAPPTPAAPDTVGVRFEADPATTRVFRKVDGQSEDEDLGAVPLELKLPKSELASDYVLRAEGYKDHTVTVDASRDRVVRSTLDRVAVVEKKAPKPPGRPKTPKRPAIHDADGLAVPSF